MTSRLRMGLVALSAISFVVSLIVPASAGALLSRVAVSALAVGAIWVAVARTQPRRSVASRLKNPDPWTLLGAALVGRIVVDALQTISLSPLATVIASLFSVAAMISMGWALLQMMRQRFGDRANDHISEAVIAAGTVALVSWVTLIEPVLDMNGMAITDGILPVLAVIPPLIMASGALFLRWSFPNRPAALNALALSLVTSVLVVQMHYLASSGGLAFLGNLGTALGVLVALGFGIGATDSSMNIYEEPTGPAGARLGRARLIALVFPVLIGPLLLTLCLTNAVSLSPMAVATFTIVLSLLVVGHLLAMVQARASSTHWASHDKLTGLPNRALFRERTAQALERSRKTGIPVAIMYLDLDRFKHINDSMGHEAGDQLLEQVARRIVAGVDASDTVARLGGDEFAILLPEVHDQTIPRKLARRLLKNFSTPFNLKPRPVFMSPSIGIAVAENHVSLETLLTQADTAMYRAKESGRNNFAVWSQDMNEAAKQRLMLETHLHSAISNSELRLVYQPKVDLRSGDVVGVEALIRWHHPKLGIISPAAFIHVAEESGLINQIGEWVLEEACRQAKAWLDNGFANFTMAVNLSSRQFQQQRMADLVSSILRKNALPAELLELELTESMAMSGDDNTLETLEDLRQMGVKCSIDDFGTGYSNLSYLSRFPIDALKIDKSFVSQIEQSDGDAALVVAIIAMAHGLGMKVIAEGVETPEQVAFLVEHDCDIMQGYLFSRPIPPEEIESLLMLEHISGGSGRLGLGFAPKSAAAAGAVQAPVREAAAIKEAPTTAAPQRVSATNIAPPPPPAALRPLTAPVSTAAPVRLSQPVQARAAHMAPAPVEERELTEEELKDVPFTGRRARRATD